METFATGADGALEALAEGAGVDGPSSGRVACRW
jgi:hypothetical protein